MQTQGCMIFALRAKLIPPWAGIERAYSALRLRRHPARVVFEQPHSTDFQIKKRTHAQQHNEQTLVSPAMRLSAKPKTTIEDYPQDPQPLAVAASPSVR